MKKYLIVGLVAATAIAVYFYLNKPHRSVREETALRVSADSLFLAFQANEAEANTKYLNQVIVVKGKVKSVETNTEGKIVIVLDAGDIMFGVSCTMAESETATVDQVVFIKGICTGYLADVIITQAIIESR